MKRAVFVVFTVMAILGLSRLADAHFGMLIPSDNMIMQQDPRTITLTLSFSHPMEMVGMDMARPKRFGVRGHGKTEDLLGRLSRTSVMGQTAWQCSFRPKRPGAWAFFMEPEPYWEPAEDVFIIHYTKTVVGAFGGEEGWDEELGLKAEIVPLTRPFGLYAGNVFQGIVKLNGKPVPYAEVEVEYYNQDKRYLAPTDYMITQVIKTDGNGVLTFAAPWPGWWGFAALHEGDFTIPKDGVQKGVELGGVIWVRFEAPRTHPKPGR